MARQFVLLDRDGTIIEERYYLSDPRQVELIPGVADSMRLLGEMGLGLLIVTNQSGVGRGFFDKKQLDLIHRRLLELLEAEGVHISGIYACLHTPEDDCACRKPRPGLIDQAAREFDFNPRHCFVVGDKVCDVELGRQVGATTLLVRTGYGAQVAAQNAVAADYVVDSLWDAAQIIGGLIPSKYGKGNCIASG